MINERIKLLKEQSINITPYITPERALLITEFYKNNYNSTLSIPEQRALAFKYILENKKISINDGELIVGERGPAPKATPTYPEVCCHSLQDLHILNSREKIPFKTSQQLIDVYRNEIIPFWKGKSMRDKIFIEVSDEWKEAYYAGVFTEFLEQRAPGHTVLDNKIYRKGFLDFKKDIANAISSLNYHNDPEALSKKEQLRAMNIAATALINYAKRYSILAKNLSKRERNPQRKKELIKISQVCAHVPAYAPRDFWEAIQYYWFAHLGVIIEYNTWDSFNPGRLDQHLYPFYKKQLQDGSMTEELARELLQVIRTYFRLDGHHIQFNVVTANTLRNAQKYPEKYKNLIVRVAGYSDYFINLGEKLQNEIIKRTEHLSF